MNGSLPNVLTDGTFKYVYGLGLTYAVDGAGNVQVYHTDGLGSARAITNGSGTLIQTYQTDEFGIPTQSNGTSTQPFGFTGQQVDGNGLVYLRARYYDPTSGRFTSRDPAFGSPSDPLSLSRFGYALGNPLVLSDPSGLSANRATTDGSTDNECFSTAGGLFQGNIVNARCFDTPTGSQVVIAFVDYPPPPHWGITIVFARTGNGEGGTEG